MLNSFIAIIAALISVSIGIFFLYYLIREICHFFELKEIQLLNKNKYINTTPQQLYERIYSIKYINQRACEKKSVNSVFYDYIFTYPAL